MSEETFEYLGKFDINGGGSPDHQILVIRGRGALRFVGRPVDQPGTADTPAEWESQLRDLLSGMGLRTVDLRYIESLW